MDAGVAHGEHASSRLEGSVSDADPHALLDAMRAALPALGELEVTLEATATVRLPAWTGGTLHGALGWALRDVACSERCERRHEAEPERCAFSRLFVGAAPRAAKDDRQAAPPVPALSLRPPSFGRPQVLSPGTAWSFHLTLLGEAAFDDAPALLAALSHMAERGLGRQRGALRVVSVRAAHLELWKGGRVRGAPPAIPASEWAAWTLGGALHLRARTPLHIKQRGRVIEQPSLADTVEPSLRRLVTLAAARGAGAVDVHVRDLAAALCAELDGEEARSWDRFEAKRWSERQGRRHEVAGVVGELWCDQVPAPVASLLTWASAVGIGKGTAMGLGHFDVRLQPAAAVCAGEPLERPRGAAQSDGEPAGVVLDGARLRAHEEAEA